jgi:hypothetical protein
MDLEQRLRRVLIDDRLALPAFPDPVARVAAGIDRRRRWRRIIGAALATLLALLGSVMLRVTAFAPAEPGPEVSPSLAAVPWLDDPISPGELSPAPTPRASARPCTAADLAPTATVHDDGAAAGSHFTTIAVAHVGTTRCTLAGSARLIATNMATGKRASVPTQPSSFHNGDDLQSPATIDPGELAMIGMVTGGGCDGGATMTTYTNVTLETLGREYPLAGLTLATACVLQVSDWYFEPPSQPQPVPRYAGLTAVIEAPATVRAGSTLDFVVTLTNPTDAPIALDPCPVYSTGFFKGGGFYHLNCAVRDIPAHGSVRFAMRIQVVDYTPLGPTQLRWEILEAGDSSAAGQTSVEVTA